MNHLLCYYSEVLYTVFLFHGSSYINMPGKKLEKEGSARLYKH